MMLLQIKKQGVQLARFCIQLSMALLWIWIGIEFSFFVKYLATNGAAGYLYRPPGVEGFLPISSLMNVSYFFQTGELNMVHPAGVFIFLSIIAVSLIFGKSFCSWFCAIGTLSEYLANLGQIIFKRKIKMPKIIDSILRGIKYLLLSFFCIAIFSMNVSTLGNFLNGDYNMVADIRMYDFFTSLDAVAIATIVSLLALSFVFRGFWCRYLCPYGALLGIVGFFSPNKIKRNTETCINCQKCAKVCPAFIAVDKVKTVISDECTSCLQCISVCPVKNTLSMQTVVAQKNISKKMVAIIIVAMFLIITGLGMALNKWNNNIAKEKYLELYPQRQNFKHH